MSPTVRSCWRNCYPADGKGALGDKERLAIDAMEDALAPLDESAIKIRKCITCFEACHHKAPRWLELIIQAIGSGSTSKGPGTRPPGKRAPIEQVWQHAVAALSAWSAGCPAEAIDLDIGGRPGSQLLALVGSRTPLKEWQVQRIADKIREYVVWPRPHYDPSARYVKMVGHPQRYAEHYEFRDLTMQTVIHDTVDGREAEITLAAAIDNLEACHWNFIENLTIVLGAVGGDVFPKTPFAACGRNRTSIPLRDRMKIVSNTLQAFCQNAEISRNVDRAILEALGAKTPIKHWLAASLDKTIRAQLRLEEE